MAKHIYDKDGNYTGKVLSESEHQRENRPDIKKCYICSEIASSTYSGDKWYLRDRDICSDCNKKSKKSKDEFININRIITIKTIVMIIAGVQLEKIFDIPSVSYWYYILMFILWLIVCAPQFNKKAKA